MEKTKAILEQMEDNAQMRFNMGEYSLASALRYWARKLRSATIEDEKKLRAQEPCQER
ncbi:TPA: hypothetical protein HA278_04880 [Candidatus Woesearchaeota archaeon]|nr:hypothetical protein [Candidatus Woesearchaeota archaeon]